MKIETALIACEDVAANLLWEGNWVLHLDGSGEPTLYTIAEIVWDGQFVGDVTLVTTDGSRIVLPDGSKIVRVLAR